MDKTMRCQCGRQRTVALDKNFSTVLLCLECDEVSSGASRSSGRRMRSRLNKRSQPNLALHRPRHRGHHGAGVGHSRLDPGSGRLGQIIDKMSGIATTVATAVEQQGAATAEIARNIQQSAAGTQHVSQDIAGVSTAANLSGETASDVLRSSDSLAAEGRFLSRIKAA